MAGLLTAVLVATPALCSPVTPGADSLRALYQQGRPFAEFLSGVRARREMWVNNAAWGQVDEGLLARARAVPGAWRLLVVAEDACGDSANTIPYLAAFVGAVGGAVELRIVSSGEGRAVQEAHRTHDGRAATPTVVLLDGDWREAGCWVERPRELALWAREHRSQLSDREFSSRLFAWYDQDRGRQTIREILELIEGAGPGRPCLGNT